MTAWISGRERMITENISWSISTKECCRPGGGSNPQPSDHQANMHPNEPLRTADEKKKKKRVFFFFKLGIVQCCHCLMSWDSSVCSKICLPTRCTTLPHGFESGLGHKDVVYVRKVVSSLTTEVVSQKVFPRQQQTTKAFLHHQTVLQGWLFSGVTGAENMKRRKILMTTLYIIHSSHREISPSPAEAGCTMHLETAEEANGSGSALFVIQYVNLYQQTGSSNLNGWQSGRGISIYSA